MEVLEIQYLDIEEKETYEIIIRQVVEECFKTENLKNLYIEITLTTPKKIREINKKYRNIDKSTDVLSFPMFEKDEIKKICNTKIQEINEILGSIIISIEQVEKQAVEYGHSFERELAYMVVHGFYHLMGYDHMEEEEKKLMRKKEENVLNKLKINR